MNITRDKDGIRLKVHVQPKAKKNAIVGPLGDALKIRVESPPVEGAANRDLVKLLSKTLDLPSTHVKILSGHSSRRKTIRILGISEQTFRSLLHLGGDD